MNRHLLIALDKTIFRLAFSIIAALAKTRHQETKMCVELGSKPRILVIRPGGLGDAIMCIPFLRKLRNLFPQANITLVCLRKNMAVFGDSPYTDKVVVIDDMKELIPNLKYLMGQDIDIVFALEPFRRVSTLVA
jgi:hypothetical protein